MKVKDKFNLNLTYSDGKQETITDTLTELTKITNKI